MKRKPMWRVGMRFKRWREVPPGCEVTWVYAASEKEAEAIARHNHGNEYGGILRVKITRETSGQSHRKEVQ